MEQGSIVFLGEEKEPSCRMVMIVSDQLIGMIQRWLIEKKQVILNVGFSSYPLDDLKQKRHYITFLPLGQELSHFTSILKKFCDENGFDFADMSDPAMPATIPNKAY